MMLVFDNIVYSLQTSGGISRFWSRITEPYLTEALFIEREDASNNLYRREQHLARSLPDHRIFKTVSRYVNFASRFNSDRHIFHSSYYRINRGAGAVNITTIHDLIYERFGGGGLGAHLHIAQKRRSLAAADCIVCVSEHTRKDLLEYYPLTRDKHVLVIPNGVDPAPTTDAQAAIGSPVLRAAERGNFFLYVGHRGSCKGFDRVYRALRLCGPSWSCVVVGDALRPQEQADITAAGLTDRVISVGRVSDAELAFLYRTAAFFFFPSLYEGFGIPPLEAMQLGCPVLASDRSSIPEVVGEAGVLFDPTDDASLERGLAAILSPLNRIALIELGRQRAQSLSWRSAVDKYSALYTGLLHAR